LNDPNILTLFGSFLGIIGSILLSIDALGAPDFLSALKAEEKKGIQMTQLGFLALINEIVVYLSISLIGFVVLLFISRGSLIASLIFTPLIYFAWKTIIYITEKLAEFVKWLGPPHYLRVQGLLRSLGCMIQLIHFLIWISPFLITSLLAFLVRFGLDLPLRFFSEKMIVPLVKRFYALSAKAIAEEQRWRFKANALVGSLFILFGFLYQFISVLMATKW